MGSWGVLWGLLSWAACGQAGAVPGTAPLLRSTAWVLRWHLGRKLCTGPVLQHSRPCMSAAPELVTVLTSSLSCVTASLGPSATCAHFCSAAGSDAPGPRVSPCAAVGLCPGEMRRAQPSGAGQSPRPGAPEEEWALALPAVGGEQAASDVTAVHGG